MIQLSVVIITFNEEKNIGRCLDSMKDITDDIVVVDSLSSDTTESICRKYGVNFIQHKWEGYSKTKNFANNQAKHDWILSLDADEALSPELRESILQWKKSSDPSPAKFARLTNYCGKWIHHSGWYPDTKLRIFDRRTTKWEGTIHETLSGADEGKAQLLKGDCFHYSYYTIEEHYKKMEYFSEMSARDLFSKKVSVNFLKMYLSPTVKFLSNYIFKLGFLDGYHGYVISLISAKVTHLKYKKLNLLYRVSRKQA